MGMIFTATEIQKIFNAPYPLTWDDIQGISMDTRTLQRGDLFIARKGKMENGAFFMKEALEKGAVGVLTETLCEDVSASKQLVVPSCDKALEALAHFVRHRFDHTSTKGTIIAITGSAGKTTVKEWLLHSVSPFLKTVASKASYNNHVGVPYSVAHLENDTHIGIFEIGMNNPGEIAPLALLTRPHVAVITSIGESHIGHLGKIESIAEEKSEILRGLDALGTAILPINTPYKDILLKKATSLCIQHVLTFGDDDHAYVRLVSFTPSESGEMGGTVCANIEGEEITYTIAMHGEHHALNSLSVLLVCRYLSKHYDIPLSSFMQRLSTFTAIQGRGARHVLPYKQGKILLIDDAYNANPSSMRAGLATLAALTCTGGGRKIAVLGDMKELGDDSPAYHRSLSLLIHDVGVDLVFAAGDHMLDLWDALPKEKRAAYAPTAAELVFDVLDQVRENDIIFVKGSKSSSISKIVDVFLAQQK